MTGQLFFNFFYIGLVSFGGGYGMISLVRETVLSHGWLTQDAFVNLIAVAESTPGPIAINMATFIGRTQGGFWGAVAATTGVVLPAFLIILAVAVVMHNLLKLSAVQAFLSGVRPCVVGLIVATAVTLGYGTLLGLSDLKSGVTLDWRAFVVLAVLLIFARIWQRKTGKKPATLLLILLSAGLGILFYGLL